MYTYVFEEFHNEKDFTRWVEKQATELKRLAYENRDVIFKDSLEREIEMFMTLTKAWKPMKELRKKSKDYELIVTTDQKGYHRIRITFPITREELDKAIEHRREVVRRLGRYGDICYKPEQSVYDTCKDRVDRTLHFATRNDGSSQRYENYRGQNLIRISNIIEFN